MLSSEDFQFLSRSPPAPPKKPPSPAPPPDSVYDLWLASRELPAQRGSYFVPGTQRPLNLANARLAYTLTHRCTLDLFKVLWGLNPFRTTLMMTLQVVRSLFPAFRGYSQALIIDELQSLIASGSFTWFRLFCLVSSELLRRSVESALDSFAAANEDVVVESARFYIEHKQLEHRVRLDVPTLSDPIVRDLLQESDLFARSFYGGGFGLLSPLDFVHIISLITEIISHIFLIYSLTNGAIHLCILTLSILSATLPLLISRLGISFEHPEPVCPTQEARAAERQERMRHLAYSDVHRPEVALFGLERWILKSWADARQMASSSGLSSSWRDSSVMSRINFSEFMFALQNIPLVLLLQTSSASLGSLSAYRSSIQSVVYAIGNLMATSKMAFQGLFLMSAFCASMELRPRLQPKDEDAVTYRSMPNGGMSIVVKGLSYTYPGMSEPALKDISFTLQPGETLAIVGYNGSGKSTLAKILLRIIDFEKGALFVNGVDIRRLNPSEYHQHITTVFQSFSKFNSTVTENVGLGYVDKMESKPAVERAVRLAEADGVVSSLPDGLRTILDTPGFDTISYPGGFSNHQSPHHSGLSGGEWQRIALARAFMRANEPDVDLLVFDEPTSSLDAHAQKQIFDTIQKISRSPSGEPRKNVIFITHRLAIARRADKIAMMENGIISEFGSHEALLQKNGSYAALYQASI
ncbi:P-loop containing nucleoside triphosphate hydrolase protein [Pluteus cervinus]|uniref:P-loop containing nucleoside triphosphate hydrolase protein n=1 Tax=Pluteus cervinus TaxID=181527 RepID=A0ACD3B4P4_9AGAR|nr:P-loop containing nucleoside triphosphate hydrolase protein [Pluteus cervinus]